MFVLLKDIQSNHNLTLNPSVFTFSSDKQSLNKSISPSQVLVLTCLVACAVAYPYPHPDEGYAPVPVYGGQPEPVYGAVAPVGRVKMQVIFKRDLCTL